MDDLKGILSARKPFYSRAQYRLDTSQQSLSATFDLLNKLVNKLLNESIQVATHKLIPGALDFDSSRSR
jgi:hypothetical protein